jgi:hypothetical protein
MPRLPIISKYCVWWRSGSSAPAKVYRMLVPCIGTCVTPWTSVGSGTPVLSSTVGATSMTWQNWLRSSPLAAMPLGQCRIVPLRVPPQCEATCLVHWYGVHIAWAQPTA